AVLWAVKKYRPYVEGTHFRVITDHSRLQWLRNLRDPTGSLARWAMVMQTYEFCKNEWILTNGGLFFREIDFL
ncbi:hypothetical protein, partial [Enterobacter cloacae complex sp. 4DZ3-17B2]|uniref:hypothetical protein n=1 Tax=Enterobacter cloacae complex sp. 4DZ3-17B2 TaxID=2511990 RepID=UPI0013EDA2CC